MYLLIVIIVFAVFRISKLWRIFLNKAYDLLVHADFSTLRHDPDESKRDHRARHRDGKENPKLAKIVGCDPHKEIVKIANLRRQE